MKAAEPVLQLLGLAARANALVPGTERVRLAVRSGSARFVVLAEDTSANSRAKLVPLMEAKQVPYAVSFDRDTLGNAVGRGPLGAVGLTTSSFAARARELLGPEL